MKTPNPPATTSFHDILHVLDNGHALFQTFLADQRQDWDEYLPMSTKQVLFQSLCQMERYDLIPAFLDQLVVDRAQMNQIIHTVDLLAPQCRTLVIELHRQERLDHRFIPIKINNIIQEAFQTDDAPWYEALDEMLDLAAPEILTKNVNLTLKLYGDTYDEITPDALQQRTLRLFKLFQAHGFDMEAGIESFIQKHRKRITEDDRARHPNLLHYILAQMRDPESQMDKPLDFILQQGADWRRLWNDPALEPDLRSTLEQHPWVRRCLLEDVSAQAQISERKSAHRSKI